MALSVHKHREFRVVAGPLGQGAGRPSGQTSESGVRLTSVSRLVFGVTATEPSHCTLPALTPRSASRRMGADLPACAAAGESAIRDGPAQTQHCRRRANTAGPDRPRPFHADRSRPSDAGCWFNARARPSIADATRPRTSLSQDPVCLPTFASFRTVRDLSRMMTILKCAADKRGNLGSLIPRMLPHACSVIWSFHTRPRVHNCGTLLR